jgi:hypothetical protein
MAIRRANKAIPENGNECANTECAQMFGVIAEALDDLSAEVKASRSDIGAVNERIAAQEAKTHNAWHSIQRVEERMNNLPREIADSITRHEQACPGRDYARHKLTASYPTPAVSRRQERPGGSSGTLSDASGLSIPKWIAYLGAILGAAGAAAGYLLHSVGVF